MLTENQMMLVKIEQFEGTDSTPTTAANFLPVHNVAIRPTLGYIDPLAQDGSLSPRPGGLGQKYYEISFDHELVVVNAAQTVPPCDPALQACGFDDNEESTTDGKYYPASPRGLKCTRLAFDAGTAAIAVGNTLVGEDSGASSTVKAVTLQSGSWGAAAAGVLYVDDITRTVGKAAPTVEGGTTATSGGTFTGAANINFKVEITTAGETDEFQASDDGGANWFATGVEVTGAAQALDPQICGCEEAWDTAQDTNVTCTFDADHQEGTNSAKMVMGAGAVAGLLATETITSDDISGKSQIIFWIKSSIVTTAGQLQLVLDNTASCATPVHILDIQALAADTWTEVTLSYNSAASGNSAIISVGVRQNEDLGIFDLFIDDIRTRTGATITFSAITGAVVGDFWVFKCSNTYENDENLQVDAGTKAVMDGTQWVPSVTIWAYQEDILWKLVGCKGDVVWNFVAGQPVILNFILTGKYAKPTDSTFPTTWTDSSVGPLVAINQSFVFGSDNPTIDSLVLGLHNTVAVMPSISDTHAVGSVQITGRVPEATINPEVRVLATDEDPWTPFETVDPTTVSYTVSSTTVDVDVSMPNCEITNIGKVDRSGIDCWDITLRPTRSASSAGDDEISIQFKASA